MAYKSIADLRDSVSSQLQGLNLNSVTNLNQTFERAARELSHVVEVQETNGRQAVTIYDGVTEYPAVTDIFGSSLIDFQKQGNARSLVDYTYKLPISNYDRTKAVLQNGTQLAFEYRNGVGIMRISSTFPTPAIELDPLTATTGWTAAGSASGLTLDATVFYQEPGALRFTLTGASTGTLTKTISSQDLTDYRGVGVVFLAFRTPSAANLTSFSIKLGSSSANYYQVSSVTTGFLGAWVANDWLLVALDLATATTVGTPVVTAITYCQISIAHAATLTNFYVGDLFIALPSPCNLLFSTAAFFQVSGGNASRTITNNNDSVLLTDEAFALYEVKCALLVASGKGGTLASGLVSTLDQKLNGVRGYRGLLIQPGLLDLYRANNPAQRLRTINNYYDD